MHLSLAPLAALALAAPAAAVQSDDEVVSERYDDLSLTVRFPGWEGMTPVPGARRGQVRERWRGTFAGSTADVTLRLLPRAEFTGLDQPADVVELTRWNKANQDRRMNRPLFRFEVSKPVAGAFGWVPYGWYGIDEVREDTRTVGHFVNVAGIVPEYAYELEIDLAPALSDEGLEELIAWMPEGLVYDGPTMDPEWTEEEVEARWEEGAPDEVLEEKELEVVRTDYYVILTDLGRGTARGFGEEMDENYETIRSIYPFDDVEGQRLLPIFYFNERDHYVDWCVKNLGWSREQASRSGGVATGDVYATHHQSATAPVHIHEATHQIFGNRLMLNGGGSWFQEGVAEYVESRYNSFNEIERAAEKGELTPLREFFVVPSLLMSNRGGRVTGGSNAGFAYKQAGALIGFVRHSDFGREKFLEWCHEIGNCARGDLPAMEDAIQRIYGVDLATFEREFVEWWAEGRRVRDWHEPAEKLVKKRSRRR